MKSEWLVRQIERLLNEAESAIEQRDWTKVQICARDVLSLEPDNADGKALLAAAERSIGQTTLVDQELAPSDPPSSFFDGRYEVLEIAGRGRSKTVYRVHDRELARDAALAVICTKALDDASRARVTREAKTLGTLSTHQNIVSVYDIREDPTSDVIYIVMEYVPCGDMSKLIPSDLQDVLPTEELVEFAVQICHGLAFAHTHKIIHRDLKPGNIVLDYDNTPKIVDFGLASLENVSGLTNNDIVGTPSYMAPEQALGRAITAQTDLYALGVIIYELVTGKLPFIGDSISVIGQHINAAPVDPSWHNPNCPRMLELLIQRLMAKDPDRRPRSAEDVISALNEIESGPLAKGRLDNRRVLDRLANGVYVGRNEETDSLKVALETAIDGKGQLIMLSGEPGIGKTRTAQELATYANIRRVGVLWGSCPDEQGAPPYWPWTQVLRACFEECSADSLIDELAEIGGDIVELVPELRNKLKDLKPSPTLAPEQARFRLFNSVCITLSEASRKNPLLIVLDDLHWADQPSLRLLEFIAKELYKTNILLLGTYRESELSRQHPLSVSLGGLTREQSFSREYLGRLNLQEVRQFIEGVVGFVPPPTLVDVVFRRTQGVPFFITEVVRLLVQQGELTRNPEVPHIGNWSATIPEGVRAVVGRRLDNLSSNCNEVLSIASVIGDTFSLAELRGLTPDTDESGLLDLLDEALASKVIEVLSERTGSRFKFTHALIRETLLDELPIGKKVRLHAEIGKILEQLAGVNPASVAAQLAYHFSAAETLIGPDKMILYSKIAGDQALSSFAYEEAETHFQRVLDAREGLPTDAVTAEVLFGLSRAQLGLADGISKRQESLALMNRAFDYYANEWNVSRAVAIAEYPLFLGFGGTGAAQLTAKALELVESNSLEAASLLNQYGLSLYHENGDYEETVRMFEQALLIAETKHDQDLQMRVLTNWAHVDGDELNWGPSLEKNLRALDLADSFDDPRIEAWCHQYASNAYRTEEVDLDKSKEHAFGMMHAADRIRNRSLQAVACRVVQELYQLEGDWGNALKYSEMGFSYATDDTRLLTYKILLECQQGNGDTAETFLRSLIDLMSASTPGATARYSFPAVVIPLISRLFGLGDYMEVAKGAAQTIYSYMPVPDIDIPTRVGLALISTLESDIDLASEQYMALLPFKQTMQPPNTICMDHVLGILAGTMGRIENAVEHFEDAFSFCRNARYRPAYAWAIWDYATLVDNNHLTVNDPSKLKALVSEARGIASFLGMTPLSNKLRGFTI